MTPVVTWQKNLSVLKEKDKDLAYRVAAVPPDDRLQVVASRRGLPTVTFMAEERQVFFHSAYDPEREAVQWATGQDIDAGAHLNVYGFGLGYHIRALLDVVGSRGSIRVFQLGLSFFRSALETIDIAEILADPRLSIFVTDEPGVLARHLVAGGGFSSGSPLLVYGPSLRIMPPGELRDSLAEWQIKLSTIRRFGQLMETNFRSNLPKLKEIPLVNNYFGSLRGRPAVLVAGGPSLEKALSFLKKVDGVTILAVGTAVAPLTLAGVKPHFVIVTDPQPVVAGQLECMDPCTPLIVLPTVHPEVLESQQGPKLMALQAGFGPAEEMAEACGVDTVESGGSVSTTALDILIRMGADPIILTGLDLAFPDNRLHTRGTIHGDHEAGGAAECMIRNNRDGLVGTSPVFNIYRRWIEQRISDEPVAVINTSLDGAYIAGTIFQPPEYLLRWGERMNDGSLY